MMKTMMFLRLNSNSFLQPLIETDLLCLRAALDICQGPDLLPQFFTLFIKEIIREAKLGKEKCLTNRPIEKSTLVALNMTESM